jgi:hypothetical protein
MPDSGAGQPKKNCPSTATILPALSEIGLLAQRVPRSLTREGRVLLLAEVTDALLAGKLPSREAALFVGSALRAFWQAGGPLERHLRIGAPRGSHHRPEVLFRRLIADERHAIGAALGSDRLNKEKAES